MDWALFLRRLMICSIAGTLAFGLAVVLLDSQITSTDDGASVSFGPYLPGFAPTLLVTVFPVVVGLIAAASPVANGLPRSSATPLVLLAVTVPVAVWWFCWTIFGGWFVGHV